LFDDEVVDEVVVDEEVSLEVEVDVKVDEVFESLENWLGNIYLNEKKKIWSAVKRRQASE